jgi:hypothetical protein
MHPALFHYVLTETKKTGMHKTSMPSSMSPDRSREWNPPPFINSPGANGRIEQQVPSSPTLLSRLLAIKKYASMRLILTAFLLLYALVASVAGFPAEPDTADSEGTIKELLSMKNLTNLSVGGSCGPVTGAKYFPTSLIRTEIFVLTGAQLHSVQGVCLNKDTQCCNGFYTRGFCRNDPANVRRIALLFPLLVSPLMYVDGLFTQVLCCTRVQRCSDGSGFCNDVDHVSCSVPYVHGLCPGPFGKTTSMFSYLTVSCRADFTQSILRRTMLQGR